MRALFISLLLLAFSCGPAGGPGPEPGEDAGPEPLDPGFIEDLSVDGLTFNAPVSSAFVIEPQGEGAIRTGVFLVDGPSDVTCGDDNAFAAALTLRFTATGGGVPGPGTYAVGTGGAGDVVEVTGIGCDPIGGINPTGGTVTLSVADEREVEGELDVTTEQGVVTGSFRALTCGDEPLFVCQ